MKRILLPMIFIALCTYLSKAQSAKITTWKNNSKAAYTIIHDDYGASVVDGIWRYADTIAYNRGIKFTIGAISSECEKDRWINGYSNAYEYAKNVMMAQHGHEIMSHSHNHSCAVGNAGWSPCNQAIGWGEAGSFSTEIVECTNSIEDGTGHRPQYYIYPYDRFTDLANNKLKELGYMGSRTGWPSPIGEPYHRNGYNSNDEHDFFPDSSGFFRTAVQVFDNNNTSSPNHDLILNNALDNAIAKGEWSNRELHNVGWGGWGSVSLNGYRSHLNYVESKIKSGELWVGTVSELMTYQMQKLKFDPEVTQDNPTLWTVNWNSINPQYDVDVAQYLDGKSYTTPITLEVNLNGLTGDWVVTQNSNNVSFEVRDRKIYVNVYPHEGPVQFELNNQTFPGPEVIDSIPDFDLPGDFFSFDINLNKVFEDTNTVDENLIYTVSGNDNIGIDIVNGIATISSTKGWEGNQMVYFTAEDETGNTTTDTVIFNVNGLNIPFYGTPVKVPAKIEAEDFDFGGEKVAFLELDNYRIDNYRADTVDIKNNSGHTVLMENQEWLEYSIEVDSSRFYDFDIYAATYLLNTSAEFYINGEHFYSFPVEENINSIEFNSNKVYNLHLDSGTHIIRIKASLGLEIDYFEIDTPGVNTPPIVENAIADQDLFIDFTKFTIDLNSVFADVETLDENLVYTASGNTNINIDIQNGIATITPTFDWDGNEEIIFTAEDFGGLTVNDTVQFNVSDVNADPNETVNYGSGYIFTFDESRAKNCPGTMIPFPGSNNFNNGYAIESVGGGNLVIEANGQQFGTDNIRLGFNDACIQSLIDLEHPDKRTIEIRIHSTVDVNEFLVLPVDTNNVAADRDAQIRSLSAGQWHTLTFDFNNLNTWGGDKMDASVLNSLALSFRNNYNAVAQDLEGVFTIDYIKIGGALEPCTTPYIFNSIETIQGVDSDKDATISVDVAGNSFNYTWYKDNVELTDPIKYEGLNSADLIVKNFTADDTGYYYCYVQDFCGPAAYSQPVKIIRGDLNVPYHGVAHNIPGVIEAEDYDIGGNGVSFFELNQNDDVTNTYRGDEFDVNPYYDDYVLFDPRNNEWTEYTVTVTDSGLYDIEFLAGLKNGSANAILTLDGEELTTVPITATGNKNSYENSTVQGVYLHEGDYVLRVKFKNEFNLDKITFKKSVSNSIDEIFNTSLLVYPNPASEVLTIISNDLESSIQVFDTKGALIQNYQYAQNIDVSNLAPGVYFLKQGMASIQFVKR